MIGGGGGLLNIVCFKMSKSEWLLEVTSVAKNYNFCHVQFEEKL